MRTDGRTGGQTEGQTHDEAKRRFSGLCERVYKWIRTQHKKTHTHTHTLFIIFITGDLSKIG